MHSTDSATIRPAGSQSWKSPGRGVLVGAFQILGTLSRNADGMGLSEVARVSGLPKATVHRLLEQLVDLGAAHRDGQRYVIGDELSRLGFVWRPQPGLRRASLIPIRTLSRLTGSGVAVTSLDSRGTIRIVTAEGNYFAPVRRMHTDDELMARTAAVRVLLAAQPDRDPPAGFSRTEWRRDRRLLMSHGVAIDHEDIQRGVHCVAAPIPLGARDDVASVGILFLDRDMPANASDLVIRAARAIGRNLAARTRDGTSIPADVGPTRRDR